ncbi:Phenylacetate 2-hydroxylase [Venturia inaequalis]|nr:Phenylacetate 2-hydroxylase [Venturia inaequalis]
MKGILSPKRSKSPLAPFQGHRFFFAAGLLIRSTALILSIVILILNTTMRLNLDWIAFPFSFLANTNEIVYYIVWPLRKWTIQPLSVCLIDLATACLLAGQLIAFYHWRRSHDMRCAAGLVTPLCGLHIVMILLNSCQHFFERRAKIRLVSSPGFQD